MPEGASEISPIVGPKELPNGFDIAQINPTQMSEQLKKAPAIIRWPFTEELTEEPRMNVGASTCLMAYEVGGEQAFSGHFTVVTERKTADGKEKNEFEMYKNWLGHVKSFMESDKNAVLVLLGQHKSNLKAHFDSTLLEERWAQNRKKVNQDLQNVGVDPARIIDLRGPKMGSTAALYNPEEKRLYFTDYPAK